MYNNLIIIIQNTQQNIHLSSGKMRRYYKKYCKDNLLKHFSKFNCTLNSLKKIWLLKKIIRYIEFFR